MQIDWVNQFQLIILLLYNIISLCNNFFVWSLYTVVEYMKICIGMQRTVTNPIIAVMGNCIEAFKQQ